MVGDLTDSLSPRSRQSGVQPRNRVPARRGRKPPQILATPGFRSRGKRHAQVRPSRSRARNNPARMAVSSPRGSVRAYTPSIASAGRGETLAMRNKKDVSRCALGRSDKRAMSSSVSRTEGAVGRERKWFTASASSSAHATSVHAARALAAPDCARSRASPSAERSPALAPTSAKSSHRPRCRSAERRRANAGMTPTETLGARARGANRSVHMAMRWLSLIFGASSASNDPFDSPRDTRASSAPKATCDRWLEAMFANRSPRSDSREKHAALSAAGPPASSAARACLKRAPS